MRVAILHFLPSGKAKTDDIIKNLEKGAVSKGHQVTIYDGIKDASNVKLSFAEYIAVIVPVAGLFGGKLPPKVTEVLANAGMVSGKKGAALVVKGGFSSAKTSRNLMRLMEAEGIKLDYFEVVLDGDHATAVGKKLG
ncbi:MAG: hypothetical protein LBU99_04715 [Spirochaetaceae bacterium]|jgi:hypothetical protein|nr:hypothetical protein [Spirochaetaceae bacterium]